MMCMYITYEKLQGRPNESAERPASHIFRESLRYHTSAAEKGGQKERERETIFSG